MFYAQELLFQFICECNNHEKVIICKYEKYQPQASATEYETCKVYDDFLLARQQLVNKWIESRELLGPDDAEPQRRSSSEYLSSSASGEDCDFDSDAMCCSSRKKPKKLKPSPVDLCGAEKFTVRSVRKKPAAANDSTPSRDVHVAERSQIIIDAYASSNYLSTVIIIFLNDLK